MGRPPNRPVRPAQAPETPPKPETHTRRTTGQFTRDMLAEAWEATLIIACHAAVVAAILLAGKGVELLEHAMRDPTATVTVGQQAVEFGIHTAETVTAYGLIIIGTISALWTFAKRRWED